MGVNAIKISAARMGDVIQMSIILISILINCFISNLIDTQTEVLAGHGNDIVVACSVITTTIMVRYEV